MDNWTLNGRNNEVNFSRFFSDIGSRIRETMLLTSTEKMAPFILNDTQLSERGFPKNAIAPGNVFIKPTITPWDRYISSEKYHLCCRCDMIYDKSFPQGPCTHHWGKLQTNQGCLGYTCCASLPFSAGCTTTDCHVSILKKGGFYSDFVSSQPCDDNVPGPNHSIVALDCKMCFTDEDLEVTRVTLIEWTKKVLLDVIVVPERPILDYNTRFSGLKKEHFEGPTMTLEQAREEVLRYVKKNTIVLGHDLENDLIGLRIEHRKVIDMSVLFPHHAGFSLRRSLEDLKSEFRYEMSLFDDSLYNSIGDARVCLELVLMMLRNNRPGYAI